MIGLLLLIVTISLYDKEKYRALSLAIFVGFLNADFGGYGIVTNEITGVNNSDLALLFMLYVLLKNTPARLFHGYIEQSINYFTVLVFMVFIYSLLYYKIPIYMALQNGRIFLCFPLFYIFKLQSAEILLKALTYIYRFIALSSVLYILQIVLKREIMPYPFGWGYHQFLGFAVPRFYNFPPFIVVFNVMIYYVTAELKKREIYLYRALFLLALLCSFGRTMYMGWIMGMILMPYLNHKKIGWKFAFVAVLLIIASNIIAESSSDNTTINDLKLILQGRFVDNSWGVYGEATFAYRAAWIYERVSYMLTRPFHEILFGLGWFSDTSFGCLQRYHFNLGIYYVDMDVVSQLYTPDSSYGLLISRLGLGGFFVYMWMLIRLLRKLLRIRLVNVFGLLALVCLIVNIIDGFSGLTMSYPFSFSIIFILLFLSEKVRDDERYKYKGINSDGVL